MAPDQDVRPVRPVIPARPGTTASIGPDLVKVEAWDDEGYALIVDKTAGRLVRASAQSGFRDLFTSSLVAIIPGGRWLADHRPDPESPDTGYTTPVVAWGLTTEGFIEPFVWRGISDRVEEASEDYITIRHPDEREIRPGTPRRGLFT